MADDDLPPAYRHCRGCGKGTLLRFPLVNPDTGAREYGPTCLKCAAKAGLVLVVDEPELAEDRG
jgi:hypothetical protein